jgi:hypothetical protein
MNTSILSCGIKLSFFGTMLAMLIGANVTVAAAQTSDSDQVRVNVTGAAVPTTKILAVGRWTSNATASEVRSLLPAEVGDTVRLYLDGAIDQWFIQQDNSGVVFLLNEIDADKARGLLEKLPLGQAGLMKFELTPLGPISALRALIKAPAN